MAIVLSCFERLAIDVRPRPRREGGGDRLSSRLIGAKSRPISCCFVLLVGYQAFDHQDKRRKSSMRGVAKITDELISVFVGQERIMKSYLGNPLERASNEIFEAWLCRGCDRHRNLGRPSATECRSRKSENPIELMHPWARQISYLLGS
jgi:hypothetical protein